MKESIFSNTAKFRPFKAEGCFKMHDVNIQIIETLEKEHLDLIDALHSWMLIRDENLIPKLHDLSKVIYEYYDKPDFMIYRGFDITDRQEDLGMAMEGLFFRTLAADTGSKHTSEIFSSLSFTTSIDLAAAYGKNIISINSSELECLNVLPITKELSFIIAGRENTIIEGKVPTHNEVIILPPETLNFELISKDGPSSINW